ncbi:MAG TPA: O-antigen ligase family protein [Hyphomicrobium sp.]|nr:O-antigen ligase family protein [Hyphomicrobium sp.]HRO50010.1 O-antigen ligase family protein [Hyphomicrobium sp.]
MALGGETGAWLVRASTLAAIAVAAAMGTSAIVFSEPAVADILMAAVIVGLPLLGVTRFGHTAILNLMLWLVLVACGIAACAMSTTMNTAITHQVVTLYLVLGAFVLAGYIAADPEPRFHLVMRFYTLACVVAAVAGLAGYFNVLPSAYELFTNHGRARGTFKDPNVFGAALAPAIVYTAWIVLRFPLRQAAIAAAVSFPLMLALLLSFSRGAWISAAFSLLIAVWLSVVTTRRRRDHVRLVAVGTLGTLVLALALANTLRHESISSLLSERASFDQSYDSGPEGRFGGQAKAVGLILENPFGIGTHTFRDSYHEEEPHNVYLSQFLNAGWIGGMLYVISVLGTLAAGLYAARRRTVLQGPLIIATAAFAGVVLEGLVIDTDHWRHFFLQMALIWGLVDAMPSAENAEHRRHD